MPRISAATVVEHRRQVNEKLMDAASSLLAKQTLSDIEAPLKVGEIAKEAGIARSSFYRYYNTVDDLVAALVLRDFPEWKATVGTSVKEAKDPISAARAFVRANISMASDSKHAWRTAVFSYHFHQDAQREIGAIHSDCMTFSSWQSLSSTASPNLRAISSHAQSKTLSTPPSLP